MKTTRSAAWVVLIASLALSCGGDPGKTRGSCEGDDDCQGGVCFQQQCYPACTSQDACASDQVCVRKERDGGDEVRICLSASAYAGCTSDAACAELVVGACEIAVCADDQRCQVEAREHLSGCELDSGGSGWCEEGVCVPAPDVVDDVHEPEVGGPGDTSAADADAAQDTLLDAALDAGPMDAGGEEASGGDDEPFVVNQAPNGDQARPDVAALADGGFVVAWHLPGPNGTLQRVFARTFDGASARADEWAVNDETDEVALDVALATGGGGDAGDVVALWDATFGAGVAPLRIFGADGVPLAQQPPGVDEAALPYSLSQWSLAPAQGGGYLLAWSGWTSGSPMVGGLCHQALGADGAPLGALVVESTDQGLAYVDPRLASLPTGSFWLAAQEYDLGTMSRLRVSRFSAAGARDVGPLALAEVPSSAGALQGLDIAVTGDGSLVIVTDDADNRTIEARWLDAQGMAQGGPVVVGRADEATGASVQWPRVVHTADGGLLALWQHRESDASGGIGACWLGAAAGTVGVPFELGGGVAGHYSAPRSDALFGGGVVVVWQHCPPGEDATPTLDGDGCSIVARVVAAP